MHVVLTCFGRLFDSELVLRLFCGPGLNFFQAIAGEQLCRLTNRDPEIGWMLGGLMASPCSSHEFISCLFEWWLFITGNLAPTTKNGT
jgi:hypothetical protein